MASTAVRLTEEDVEHLALIADFYDKRMMTKLSQSEVLRTALRWLASHLKEEHPEDFKNHE